jgi:hypothetical protein
LLVFRNFLLSQMHPHAESAAETAEFAGSHTGKVPFVTARQGAEPWRLALRTSKSCLHR